MHKLLLFVFTVPLLFDLSDPFLCETRTKIGEIYFFPFGACLVRITFMIFFSLICVPLVV